MYEHTSEVSENIGSVNQTKSNNNVAAVAEGQTCTTGTRETYAYASLSLRFIAAILDALIIFVMVIFFLFPFYYALLYEASNYRSNNLSVLQNWNMAQNLSSLISVFYGVFLLRFKNATFGKQFVGLEVRSEDGAEITWFRVILREVVGKTISSLFFMIGFLWILFDKKNQGWHDKIAKTVVLQVREVSKARKVLAWIISLGVIIVAILAILAFLLIYLYI
ncbi:MAG: RDD family protein [Patescibacteria group bacterium]|nr:RDD family protein [Patescibacteria group bacterium]